MQSLTTKTTPGEKYGGIRGKKKGGGVFHLLGGEKKEKGREHPQS